MRTTMEDVARAAGVSRGLVSLALRGAYGVAPGTREHILEVARRMNYRPNGLAASLARRSTGQLGLFLLDLHNELFADIFDGVREVAGQAGRELVLSVGSIDGALDQQALDVLVRARADVVIAAGLLASDAALSAYRGLLHLVSVTRRLPDADSVTADDARGAALAVHHLAELGHRRILHLAAPDSDGYRDRRDGFRRTMEGLGLEPQVIVTPYSRSEAAGTVRGVLAAPERPTAIFTHNDQTALGVLDALHGAGLQAPADISVIGYDNTTASRPPGTALTTIDVHAAELGRRAAEIALGRLEDPGRPVSSDVISPTLVVRQTTGRPPVAR